MGDFNNDVVGICGLEPQTSSLSVTRSNQLSYIPNFHYSTKDSAILQVLRPLPKALLPYIIKLCSGNLVGATS